MHRLITSTLIVAALAAPAIANAQARDAANGPQPTEGVRWGLGGGLTLPVGNYSSGDKLGFHGLGLLQLPIRRSPLHLRLDAMISSTAHKNGVSGSTRILGGDVDALYHLGERTQNTRPYILGGVGLYNVHVSAPGVAGSNTNFGMNLGGGMLFGIGRSTHAFVEARYVDVFTTGGSTGFVPITVGLMFNGNR